MYKIPAVQFTYDFLCYIMLLIILNEFACLGKLVLDPCNLRIRLDFKQVIPLTHSDLFWLEWLWILKTQVNLSRVCVREITSPLRIVQSNSHPCESIHQVTPKWTSYKGYEASRPASSFFCNKGQIALHENETGHE